MNNGFKKHLCRSQLFIMCSGLVCIVLVVYIYSNNKTNYQQDKQFLLQEDFSEDDDTVTKPPDKSDDVNKNKSDQKNNNNNNNNNQQKENHNSNQDANQQKVKLPNKPGKENKDNKQKANDQINQNITVPGMNITHINGLLMEPVNADYTRNIYFTVKTTFKFYTKRIFPIMLTWLQLVDKDKLSIISDKYTPHQNYVNLFRKAGFQVVINNLCWDTHSRWGLCCKTVTEFDTYYKAVKQHPGEEDRYQWFCHSDDDVYIDVPKLSHFLQKYDPHKPYYIGKWPQSYYEHPYYPLNNKSIYHLIHDKKLPLKQTVFQYATGSTYCVSYALMMEAQNYLYGLNKLSLSTTPRLADDMTVGFVMGSLLGYNVTDVADMTNQYDDYVQNSTLNELAKYLTISTGATAKSVSLDKLASSLKTPLPSADPTRLLLYHCLLYPTISWCDSVRETLNSNGYRKT